MKKIVLLFLLFAVPCLAQDYYLDKAHSSIEFSVKHLGLFPVKGKFKDIEGSTKIKKGVAKDIYIKINVDSIDTNEEDRDAHLKSKDFFHVRDDLYELVPKNRYIEFWLKSYDFSNKKSTIRGKLKILKTKKSIPLKVTVSSLKANGGVVYGVVGRGKLNRKHFKLSWQKPTTGTKEKLAGKFVGDEVEIIANLTFKPKKKNKK